jgi:hypothetical protein
MNLRNLSKMLDFFYHEHVLPCSAKLGCTAILQNLCGSFIYHVAH